MITNQIIDMVKRHESFRGRPYTDSVGKITIGYGRNLQDNPLSPEEGEYLLKRDLVTAELDARSIFRYFDSINEPRQAALIDMSFNLGRVRLLGFRKFIEAVDSKNWVNASNEMLNSLWAQQVGKRAIELAKIMETGDWVR